MARINRALFSVSWTTNYPSLLASVDGRLITQGGYMNAFGALDDDWGLPWKPEDELHWSFFWAYYLGKPERLRANGLSADAAWERMVPFQWKRAGSVGGPAGAAAQAEVLIFPTAISIIIHVEANGDWGLAELPAALAGMRESKDWSLTSPQSTSTNRSLDGIATDLRNGAAPFLKRGAGPEPGPQEILTVSAPAGGQGDLASFDLGDKTASSCLAGLAVLGPPGTLLPNRLLDPNIDSRHASRIYVLKQGHAIWNPQDLCDPPDDDPIGCLHRNHTDLVTLIAALSSVVRWAGDRVAAHIQIPFEVQPLVKRAAGKLRQLHAGEKTYRSEVAKRRVEPLLSTLDALDKAL